MNKMLVVSAHAADWCTRSGGTIAKYVAKGWEVTVFALTYGEHGESGGCWLKPGTTLQEVKDCRRREATAAAQTLGVKEIRFFDYGDYPLFMDEERIRRLTADLLEFRPDVVLTHWMEDPTNNDHEVCAKAVFRAVMGASTRGALPDTEPHCVPDVFLFETTIPHSEFNNFKIDTYIDIGDVYERKVEAVKKFEAQPFLVDFYSRCAVDRARQASNWARGRDRRFEYVEAFKHYTPFIGAELPLSRI